MEKVKSKNKVTLEQRKNAYRIWALSIEEDEPARLERIARDVGMTVEQVEYYQKKDKWEKRLEKEYKKGTFDKQVKEGMKKIQYEPNQKEINEMQKILDESNLPDRRKLFIMYYLQSYNVTWSATKAGYSKNSANIRGNVVLNDPVVRDTLNKLKNLMHDNIYINAHDIIDKYIKIAFSDITDFVDFEGDRVDLKPSSKVDGTLITEIKQGRDGVTIKLADKMKALERLEKLFEIMPDRKLELEREKFEFTKEMTKKATEGEGTKVTIINDIG